MKIGVISDTHGLLRPEALYRLSGVDHILHAGDIGGVEVIDQLSAIAPVTAIRGNNDTGGWAQAYPEEAVLELQGRTILILHDLKTLSERHYDVIVSGHSHKPNIETRDGVLYLNPGSAGPRRFKLPTTVAILKVQAKRIAAEILQLIG